MNTEEQTVIDSLFGRIRQAEDPQQPRDPQAQSRIEEHLRQQPAAPYYMAQAILVQEAAIKRLDEQNRQLQEDLKQARAQQEASRPAGGGGFLSSIFGGNTRAPEPEPQRSVAPPSTGGGGWRNTAPQMAGQAQQPAFNQQAAGRAGAGSFLGGALQTAAGVAGGVLLAQGISSLFNDSAQPDAVADAAPEAAAPASNSGGWNEGGQEQVADNGNWDNGNQDGFADGDYGADDGGFFSDDDTFV